MTAHPPINHTATDPGRLPRSFFHDGTSCQRGLDVRTIADRFAEGKGTLWVHLDTSNRSHVALLEKAFKFHPLTIEDTLNPVSRPKVDAYDSYLFVTLRVVKFQESTDDPYDLETTNLYLYIGSHFLVTAQTGPSPYPEQVAELCLRTDDLVARGAARLAHQIMDVAVDGYFPILDRVDDFVDSLEERVFASFDETVLRDIFAVKRLVLTLRRYLLPQREIFNILSNRPSNLLGQDVQLYFRDIYDHMLRISDSMETYRDLLTSTMESYLSQVSNRLNVVTKGLSLVATLSVPFVVMSGMWGMNFTRIPFAAHPWGFEILLGIQLLMGLILVVLLRRLRWL